MKVQLLEVRDSGIAKCFRLIAKYRISGDLACFNVNIEKQELFRGWLIHLLLIANKDSRALRDWKQILGGQI